MLYEMITSMENNHKPLCLLAHFVNVDSISSGVDVMCRLYREMKSQLPGSNRQAMARDICYLTLGPEDQSNVNYGYANSYGASIAKA